MFNKRDQEQDSADRNRESATTATQSGATTRAGGGPAAVIGPSIVINGELKGQEDLIVEGTIEGTVELKQNTLTIGSQGTLKAQVYAHTILVDGTVDGDLYASERISIRKTARIQGNILAPRISLEDGARFRGSIDMDAESEAFRKVFRAKSSAASSKDARPNEAGAKDAGGTTPTPNAASKDQSGGNPAGKPAQSAV